MIRPTTIKPRIMFQKTFIRFAITVAFTFTIAILLMAATRQHSGCAESPGPAAKHAPAVYGEYIIWESLGSTVLSVGQ